LRKVDAPKFYGETNISTFLVNQHVRKTNVRLEVELQ
jgi:hypothetical protein